MKVYEKKFFVCEGFQGLMTFNSSRQEYNRENCLSGRDKSQKRKALCLKTRGYRTKHLILLSSHDTGFTSTKTELKVIA